MPRIFEIGTAPGTQFRAVMAHRPEIAGSWAALDELMRFSSVLPPGLKEEVRRSFMYVSEMLGAVLHLGAATPEQGKGYESCLQAEYARFERTRAQAPQ